MAASNQFQNFEPVLKRKTKAFGKNLGIMVRILRSLFQELWALKFFE